MAARMSHQNGTGPRMAREPDGGAYDHGDKSNW